MTDTTTEIKKDKKKILVVEDSSTIQNLTKRILEFYKYDVKSAKNGIEALALLKKNNYDVILMDITMPKMDGVDCVKNIRAMPDANKSKIPIIAVTGNANSFSEIGFKAKGFSDYVIKPPNFDKLVDLLNKYTGQ